MNKWIKILLLAVVALPVTAAVLLATLVEPNDYKDELESLVSEKTAREFVIQGPIELSFLPWLGFKVEGLRLANHAQFSAQPMLSIEQASARLKLLPLLTGKLQINSVVINGLTATLGLDAKGQSSWADLLAEEQTATESSTPAEASDSSLPDFSLTKLAINNAALLWIDKSAGSETRVAPINLAIGQAQRGQRFPLAADLKIRQEADGLITELALELEAQARLSANGQIDLSPVEIEMQLQQPGLKDIDAKLQATMQAQLDGSVVTLSDIDGSVNKMTMGGQLAIQNLTTRPALKAELALGEFNSERFFVESETSADDSAETKAADDLKAEREQLNQTPVDVSALKTLDAEAEVRMQALIFDGLRLQQPKLSLSLKNGRLNLSELSAQLYEGQLQASATVNAAKTPASFSWQHQLQGVQAEPMQQDVMQQAYIRGLLSMQSKISSQGATVGAVRKNLNGDGKLSFGDGALKGINIAAVLRQAYARYKKQPTEQTDKAQKETDFSAISASFTISQGLLNNPDLLMESPLLRVTGKGTANLYNEALDYRAQALVVGSLEGQGSTATELDGLPIPIKCGGELQAPDCATDYSGLLKQQADAALEKEKAKARAKLDAEKAEAEAKAKQKLQDKAQELLNKWR